MIEEEVSGYFCQLLHGGPPGEEGKCGEKTDNVKSTVGKWHRNLTMGRETALYQIQYRENRGTTNSVVFSRRERTDEEEDQIIATGEEKVGNIRENEGARGVEKEEGEWLTRKGRLPSVGLAAPPQGAQLV